MHEPGKYKVHDAGLQAWLRYQKIQPLYWERDGKYLPKDPPETWYDTLASIGRKPSQRETL